MCLPRHRGRGAAEEEWALRRGQGLWNQVPGFKSHPFCGELRDLGQISHSGPQFPPIQKRDHAGTHFMGWQRGEETAGGAWNPERRSCSAEVVHNRSSSPLALHGHVQPELGGELNVQGLISVLEFAGCLGRLG